MVRVPGPGRFELRLPDGAANPYLLQAVIIAAGLDGIRSKADPGKRYDIDMYQHGHTVKGAPKLPLNLLDALQRVRQGQVAEGGAGGGILVGLPKAEAPGMEFLRFALHAVGAGQHARHLTGRTDFGRAAEAYEIFDLLARPRGSVRPQEMAAHLARPGTEAPIRRGDHRRRRARSRHRLPPRRRIRHHQRRGAGEGLDRLRQRRPQHHDHPLQLPAARQYRLLRAVDEAVGDDGARPQLQHHGQPARRAEPLPFRRAARRLCAARQRHAHQRHRRRAARPGRREEAGAVPQFRQCALSDPGRAAAAARRHGAA